MMELKRTDLSLRAERAVLIQVRTPNPDHDLEKALEELHSLARTAGANVVGQMVQKRTRPEPGSYFGSGKIKQLKRLCQREDINLVICDDDLSPGQVKNLEENLEIKVVDRSEVILDIFATHARTKQAKLQIELAQLEYTFPRLKRMWTHLDRTAGGTLGGPAGGGIGVRGPGEKQLEVDRRLVQKQIHELKKELQSIQKRCRSRVKSRKESFTTAVLVGYTNAGKSSIMNALTGANLAVRDRLFETLDTRTKQWELPDGRSVLLSDTVGFIRKLPHHLVASFQATLEEAHEADLLIHVIDGSAGNVVEKVRSAREVLQQIGCGDKPVISLVNKIDALEETGHLPLVRQEVGEHIYTSAKTGEGLDQLTQKAQQFLDRQHETLKVVAGVGNGRLLSFLYENGSVTSRNYNETTVELEVKVPPRLTGVIEGLGGRVQVLQPEGSLS